MQNCLLSVMFFLFFFLFGALILPIALDREFARQDVVKEYNCKHYKACGGK